MRQLPGLALAGLLYAAVPDAAAQCAMCRTALEASEEGQAMAVKLNRGILLLLLAPFSVAGLVGVAMVRSRRRLQRGL